MAVDKRSSTRESPIGAKPVDKSGQSAQKPITTIVENIWSVEYCRQHPQNAAEAIKTLKDILSDREQQITALQVDIRNIREALDERI